MKLEKLLSIYKKSLQNKETTINRKIKVVKEFCHFLEKQFAIESNDLNFNQIAPIAYENIVYRMPLNETIIQNYLTKECKDLKDHSYNTRITYLKEFFDFLLEINEIQSNPMINIEKRKTAKRDMTDFRLNFFEAIELLKAAYNYNEHVNRNFTLVNIFLSTSVRIGELVKITVEDIKYELNLIYASGKSGKRNRLMTPGLRECIDELINDPLRKKALEGYEDYLLYSEKGGPLTTAEINDLLKAFAKKAGINKDITSYWLRRTYANTLVQSGFSIIETKTLFAHDAITSTEHYAKIYDNNKVKKMLNESRITKQIEELIKKRFINKTK